MSSTIKYTLYALVLAVFAVGLYYMDIGIEYFTSASLTEQDVEVRTQEVEQDVFQSLARVKKVELDDAVLSSDEYLFLRDQYVLLNEPSLVRENPFILY